MKGKQEASSLVSSIRKKLIIFKLQKYFRFSRLGGLLFDKEVRALVSFFTSGTSWSIREKFFRLTQMATILNLESVEEIQDFQENWKFSSSEIKQILQLRVDFISEEIKRLRL